MTERRHITCPETGHLEEVELVRTPLGLVVDGCSRLRPTDGVCCQRECARRLDRGDLRIADGRDRVLIVLANLDDEAARVASLIAEQLATDNLRVEIADLASGRPPPVADYDAVLIGAQVHLGRHRRTLISYIRDMRDTLAALPAFFYSVGGHGVLDREGYIQRMIRRTGWRPTASATFANADHVQRPDIRAFARQLADEIPATLQPQLA